MQSLKLALPVLFNLQANKRPGQIQLAENFKRISCHDIYVKISKL